MAIERSRPCLLRLVNILFGIVASSGSALQAQPLNFRRRFVPELDNEAWKWRDETKTVARTLAYLYGYGSKCAKKTPPMGTRSDVSRKRSRWATPCGADALRLAQR